MTASGGPALGKALSDRDSASQIGWGAERLNGSLGFGGDIDYVYCPPHTYALSGGQGTATEPSLNMAAATMKTTYHFGHAGTRSRARPFVAGSVSFLFSEGEYGMILLSGGFDWWTSQRAGIRVEVRGQIQSCSACAPASCCGKLACEYRDPRRPPDGEVSQSSPAIG